MSAQADYSKMKLIVDGAPTEMTNTMASISTPHLINVKPIVDPDSMCLNCMSDFGRGLLSTYLLPFWLMCFYLTFGLARYFVCVNVVSINYVRIDR